MTLDELHASHQQLDQRLASLEAARPSPQDSKNWMAILSIALPLAGTIGVAIITAGSSWVAAQTQAQQTLRTQIAALNQQAVDNDRQAANMYFTNLSDLRNKDKLTPGEKKRFARDMEIVAAISGNDELKDIMTRASRDAAVSVRLERTQQSAAQGGATTVPSTSLSALPDLTRAKAAKDYAPSDFLAYPEIPATRWNADTQGFRNALTTIGFGTQVAEKIRPELAPHKNEVRYYKPEHARVAAAAAAQLTKAMGQKFVPKLLGGGATLPNGVMEFWLGTSPDPA